MTTTTSSSTKNPLSDIRIVREETVHFSKLPQSLRLMAIMAENEPYLYDYSIVRKGEYYKLRMEADPKVIQERV